MSLVTIIDYDAGNLHSAAKAFERMAQGLGGITIEVTADPERVRRADRIMLPGVGAFADCKAGLDAVPGMVEVLEEAVIAGGTPFLGVCVGMQLMASEGREKTVTPGLGWIPGAVQAIVPSDPALKVPHMGWNTISITRAHKLFDNIPDGPDGLHAYFVHSYHLAVENPDDLVATTSYGGPVTAFVANGNKAGAQFHPEKSQTLGLALISNFLRWKP